MQAIGKVYFLFGLGALAALSLFTTEIFLTGENNLPKYHLYWLGFLAVLPALFPWSFEKKSKKLIILSVLWIFAMWGAAYYFIYEIQGDEAFIGLVLVGLTGILFPAIPVMHMGYKLKILRKFSFLIAPIYIALMVWQRV